MAALRVAMKNSYIALIKEPWTYKGEIKGLKQVGGELIYSRSNQNPRTCLLVKKYFKTTKANHIKCESLSPQNTSQNINYSC